MTEREDAGSSNGCELGSGAGRGCERGGMDVQRWKRSTSRQAEAVEIEKPVQRCEVA